jgi:hypothetical protein
MPPDDFFESLARSLWAVPECPRNAESVTAVAHALQRMCSHEEEAVWLVDQAQDWEAWKGIGGLKRLLNEKRYAPSVPLERRVIDLGPKPPVNCAQCQDWGYLWRTGKNEYCSCAEGVRVQTDASGLLEVFNKKNIKGPQALQAAVVRRPVSEADLEAAFLDRQKWTEESITRAKAKFAAADATKEEKELARETLKTFGVEEP